MYLFLSAICIFLSVALLFKNGVNRLLLYMVGITFLPYGLELTGKLIAPRLLTFAFLLSVLLRFKEFRSLKQLPAKWLMVILFIAHLLTGLMDHRISMIQGLIKAITMFVETFGGIILGYVSFIAINKKWNLQIRNRFVILALVVCIYSLFCVFINSDPYSSAIGDTDSMIDSRLRSASFFYNSHVAGMAMTGYFILLLYFKQKYKFNQFQNLVLLLLFIAIFLTGSRSSLLCLIAGFLILYYDIVKRSKYKFKILFGSLLMLCIGYGVIGHIVIAKFADAFQDDGGETGGSNIAMRLQQLSFSWELFWQSPWFGNGFNYFWEYIKAKDGYLSSMLLGAESYVFILLIERGLIQIIAIFIYFVSIIRYFSRAKTLESYLGLALLTAFLVNSIVTGNLYKWIFVMPLIGYYLHYVQFQMKQK